MFKKRNSKLTKFYLYFRLENWSKEMVGAPSYAKFNYGQASNLFPFVPVRPGHMEINILKQVKELSICFIITMKYFTL